MSKRIVVAVAVVASLAVTPAFAGAKPPAKSHRVTFSGVIATLSSTGAVGVPGTRVFNPLGSIKFKATATWTVNPNATESYTGILEITGGTGLYRTAHGTAEVAGTAPANGDSDAATISLTGKIIY